MDVFGKALTDYYEFGQSDKLWLHNNYGKPEDMPVEVFFRSGNDIPELEEYALALCRGKILDIGAGVGVHSLILQSKGFDVTALEISGSAAGIMSGRGVKSVINMDIASYTNAAYDTLLLLMNGIGLAGDMEGLNALLPHLKNLLKENGQIILDSSDIAYLYNARNLPRKNYYGEISYRYEYQGNQGEWFKWLYIDFNKLSEIAAVHGMLCQLLIEDGMDQYLARLTKIR
ncbi:SAM-dependent methyltransferase [Daejeonella sp. JGW-45]|uniref:class I SAM-dependent methyltransferase n=1 Tax=Daejeonella sp. JGW-45 TaxID=3034148 RepID=UPI0023EBB7A1|nr:SAM-dependent methyltransferase [Daejeonella sp. JGW-45]